MNFFSSWTASPFLHSCTFQQNTDFQILDLQTSENAKKGVFFSYKNNFVACKQKLFSWKPRICHELKKLHKLAATLLAEAKRFQLTIKNVRNNTLHEQNDLNS